jgi:hypothetical protein
MTTLPATVLRSTANGMAYIATASHEIKAFSFDKIKGYKGETARELGLVNGKQVMVEYNEAQEVDSVVIPAE